MSANNATPVAVAKPVSMSASQLRKERCDRCGQRAYVVTVHLAMTAAGPAELPLAWCAHHYGEHKDAVEAHGARVIADARTKLAANA